MVNPARGPGTVARAVSHYADVVNSPKNQAHLLSRDGSTRIANESLLLNPRNYSRLDPTVWKTPKPGFSFVGTMKSIGIDYLSARQIVCPTSRRFYYRRGHHVRWTRGIDQSTRCSMMRYSIPFADWMAGRASGFRRDIVAVSQMYLAGTSAIISAGLWYSLTIFFT